MSRNTKERRLPAAVVFAFRRLPKDEGPKDAVRLGEAALERAVGDDRLAGGETGVHHVARCGGKKQPHLAQHDCFLISFLTNMTLQSSKVTLQTRLNNEDREDSALILQWGMITTKRCTSPSPPATFGSREYEDIVPKYRKNKRMLE